MTNFVNIFEVLGYIKNRYNYRVAAEGIFINTFQLVSKTIQNNSVSLIIKLILF